MQTTYTVASSITWSHLGRSESVKIRTLNVNKFCLEHFYTLRYNTFFHFFFMLNNISKVSFLRRNPIKNDRKGEKSKLFQ